MVTDCLTDRLGSEPILSIKRFVSIGTMLNVDGDCDCDGHGDGTCKQALRGQQQEQKHTFSGITTSMRSVKDCNVIHFFACGGMAEGIFYSHLNYFRQYGRALKVQ